MNHLNRLAGQQKVRRVLRVWRGGSMARNWHLYDDDSPLAREMLRTRVPSSDKYDGNPRRHFGQVTRQEQLARLREREQVAAYYEQFLDSPFRCEECGVLVLQQGWCGACCDAQADEFLMWAWVYEGGDQ